MGCNFVTSLFQIYGGAVAQGSIFAGLQSVAMGGSLLGPALPVVGIALLGVGAAVGVGVGAAVLVKTLRKDDYVIGNDRVTDDQEQDSGQEKKD